MQQVKSRSVLTFVINCCGLCYCIECVSVSLCVTFVSYWKNGSVCVLPLSLTGRMDQSVCYLCVTVRLYHLCVQFWCKWTVIHIFLIEPCWHEKVWFCKMSEGRNLWAVSKTHHNAETSLGCKTATEPTWFGGCFSRYDLLHVSNGASNSSLVVRAAEEGQTTLKVSLFVEQCPQICTQLSFVDSWVAFLSGNLDDATWPLNFLLGTCTHACIHTCAHTHTQRHTCTYTYTHKDPPHTYTHMLA